jgi:hypothetical protein
VRNLEGFADGRDGGTPRVTHIVEALPVIDENVTRLRQADLAQNVQDEAEEKAVRLS